MFWGANYSIRKKKKRKGADQGENCFLQQDLIITKARSRAFYLAENIVPRKSKNVGAAIVRAKHVLVW